MPTTVILARLLHFVAPSLEIAEPVDLPSQVLDLRIRYWPPSGCRSAERPDVFNSRPIRPVPCLRPPSVACFSPGGSPDPAARSPTLARVSRLALQVSHSLIAPPPVSASASIPVDILSSQSSPPDRLEAAVSLILRARSARPSLDLRRPSLGGRNLGFGVPLFSSHSTALLESRDEDSTAASRVQLRRGGEPCLRRAGCRASAGRAAAEKPRPRQRQEPDRPAARFAGAAASAC